MCHPASGDDSASQTSQQTVIARPPPSQSPVGTFPLPPPPKISVCNRTDSGESSDRQQSESPPGMAVDPHEANYLDVAVLRCLLIRNWTEEGVLWAVRYLLGRLVCMRQHRCAHEGAFRSRCNSDSATIPARKTSKNEAANLDTVKIIGSEGREYGKIL